MKTILCYGDSNTWGYNPVSHERHDYENRWTSVLQKQNLHIHKFLKVKSLRDSIKISITFSNTMRQY